MLAVCVPLVSKKNLGKCTSARMVVTIEESAVEEEIMNMMTICRRAACSTEDPPRMAPVIMPGIAMIPITLRVGVRGILAGMGAERTSFG